MFGLKHAAVLLALVGTEKIILIFKTSLVILKTPAPGWAVRNVDDKRLVREKYKI